MTLKKRILAVCLMLFMLSSMIVSSGINAVAISGGGVPTTVDYHYGCDLSFWNVDGNNLNYSLVDFKKMKADGCEFAILRIGFEAKATRTDTLDKAFLEYYTRAREAGMQLGVYFYALNSTYAGGKADAEWVISIIEKYDMYFEYPIYYDVEQNYDADYPGIVGHDKMSGAQLNQLCLGWCETLEAAGYFPGIYSGKTYFDKMAANSSAVTGKYDLWIAHVKSAKNNSAQYGPHSIDYSGKYGMWQYAWYDCEYNGIGLEMLDVNVAYKDYPAIMETYGYNNCTPGNRSALSDAVEAAKAISHTDYTEGTLINLRNAVKNAEALLANGATDTEYGNAASYINTLLATTGKNDGGIYLSGIDKKIDDGDCVLFTPNHNYNSTTNTAAITVSNANIAYTNNIILKWDNTQNAWIVDEIIKNNSTAASDIILERDEIMIACHYGTASESHSNYTNFEKIEIGHKISFYGADIWGIRPDNYYCKLNVGSYFRFDDPSGNNLVRDKNYTVSGNGLHAGSYDADLTDGNANGDLSNMANNWFGFSSEAGGNTLTDASSGYKYGYIDFDLGEAYEINRLRIHLANISAAGVSTPWKLAFAVSDSPNGPFTECGEWVPTVEAVSGTETSEYAYWAELDGIKGFTGRYVRIIIGVTGYWAFLDEIEIYGTHEGNVAYGKDYSIVSGDKQVFGNGEIESWFSRGADLSDGAFANATSLGYDNWFVFFRQEDWLSNDGYDTVDNVETIYDTDGTTVKKYQGAIVIDLGREYNITGFNVHHLGYTSAGQFTPYGFGITASNDINGGYETDTAVYVDAGQTHDGIWTTQTDEGYWTGKTTGLSLTGRYVCITADFNSTWLFMNELEIFGTPVSTGCGDGNHIWNSGVVTTAPTCKQTGVRTYTCTDCDETKTENIPKLTAHTIGNWETVNEGGETLMCRYCTECGELIESRVVSSLGTDFIYGDANMNYDGTNAENAVNIADCILIKRNILKTYDFNADQFLRADINEDGKINISDYILCKRIILKTYSK